MIVLAIIMFVGFFLAKKDILDPGTGKKISWIVVNVCNPALMISGALGENRLPESMLVDTFKISAIMYGILLILGLLMPIILMDRNNKAYSLMLVFGNVGFMGYPLIASMYGQEAILPASIFNLFYSVLMYTYGIMVMSGKKFEPQNLKLLINSGIIACIIEIVIYAFNIKLPEFMCNTFTMLSNLTAPLSMMVIGATFATLSIRNLVTDVRILLFTLIRMIIVPLLMFPVFKLFIHDATLLGVCLVMVAVPVGSMNVMIAQQYGGSIETSAKGVAITTLLAVITMPLLSLILL